MPYADVEGALKAWVRDTPAIRDLITDDAGRINVYLAMPAASPLPSLILQRIGGGPVGRGDLPQDMSRISFDCWGPDRAGALTLSQALVEELDQLGPRGGYVLPGVRLEAAEIALWTWQPDIRIDYPRYIVDARIWSVTTD